MTLPTPLTVDLDLLNRVREVTKSDRTLGTAIHDGAAALGIEIRWHEADVLAEAVRSHYDVVLETRFVLHRDVSLDEYRRRYSGDLLRELVTLAAERGYGLVSEPVETIHAATEIGRRSPASTEDEVDKFLATSGGYGQKVVVLTGHFRMLAKAT